MSTISELKSRLNPANPQHQSVLKVLNQVQIMKGEDGKTPVKGVDYFTQEEINELLQIVNDQIQTFKKGLTGPQGQKGEHGPTGSNGTDGRDGYTPVKGVDYFTSDERIAMMKQVAIAIGTPKDGVSPSVEDVAKVVMKGMKLPNADSLVKKEELVAYLKRGGFHGGGDTVSAGTNVTITNVNGVKQISVPGGSGITRSVNNVAISTAAGSTASTDYVYLVGATATITLPTGVGNSNMYTIKNVGAGTVTVATTGGQTIDGGASATMSVQFTSIDLVSNNSGDWAIV